MTPQSGEISPNGITVQNYTANPSDPRTGLWLSTAAFTINPESPISINANVIALRRTETQKAASYKALKVGPGIPTGPLNPAPVNRNPFPGWGPITQMTWPGAPPIFSDANPTGFVLMGADFNYNNNTQIIKGCISVDERVLTPHGYFKIGEIPDLPSRTLTEYGIRDTKGVVYQGKKPYVRIRTGLHNDIKVTPDHRIRVMRGDGTLGWKQAHDLTPQDYLLCQRGHGGMLPLDRGGSERRWYAVGHLYGDGHMHKNELAWQISEHEMEMKPYLMQFFSEEGIKVREELREPTVNVAEHGSIVGKEKNLYLYASRNHEAFSCVPPYARKGTWRETGFPEAVWSLGERQLAAFLRGLYSTDGDVSDIGQISLTSTRRRLAWDVKKALNLLGVISRVHKRARRSVTGIIREWRVCIVGARSRSLFAEKVGFAVRWKQDRLEGYLATRSRQRGCKSLFIPRAEILMRSLFPVTYWIKTESRMERSTSSAIDRVRRGVADVLSESMVDRVIERAERLGRESATLQLLKMYQSQGWYFDKVERVDPGYKDIEMYDVFESDSHSYVAGGLVHHNCTGSPNPAAVMQGTMAVEGTVRLWRDGPIADPYTIPGTPFTATGASLLMNLASSAPIPQILIKHVLLTSEEFTIQGQNTPVPRTFGFAGLGDGLSPPMAMPNI